VGNLLSLGCEFGILVYEVVVGVCRGGNLVTG